MPTGHPDTTTTDLGEGCPGSPRGSQNKGHPATGHQAARQVRQICKVPHVLQFAATPGHGCRRYACHIRHNNMGNHLDILLLQLRLTTMMRSADMANIAWAVFTQDDLHFVKTTDKTGAALTFSVSGDKLDTLLFYICRHRHCPAPHMFRYLKDPPCCLGSERIAKRVLACMEAGWGEHASLQSTQPPRSHGNAPTENGGAGRRGPGKGGLEHDKNAGHLLFPPPPVSRLAAAALGGKCGRQAIYYVSSARSAGFPRRSRRRKAK